MNLLYTTNIAGLQYSDYLQLDNLEIGHSLKLIHDPTNEYDPNAIQVWYDDVRIGFIPRKDTMLLHRYRVLKQPIACLLSNFDPSQPNHLKAHLTVYEYGPDDTLPAPFENENQIA